MAVPATPCTDFVPTSHEHQFASYSRGVTLMMEGSPAGIGMRSVSWWAVWLWG